MVTEFCEDGEGETARRGCAPCSARPCRSPSRSTPTPMSPRQMCALADIIVALQDLSACRHARDRRAGGAKSCTARWPARSGRARSAPRDRCSRRSTADAPISGRCSSGSHRRGPTRQDPDVFAVSINGGFASADIAEVGPTVLVTGQGDFERTSPSPGPSPTISGRNARRAEPLSLGRRDGRDRPPLRVKGHGPLVIADYADNPGGGGYGDSTSLLRAHRGRDRRRLLRADGRWRGGGRPAPARRRRDGSLRSAARPIRASAARRSPSPGRSRAAMTAGTPATGR